MEKEPVFPAHIAGMQKAQQTGHYSESRAFAGNRNDEKRWRQESP